MRHSLNKSRMQRKFKKKEKSTCKEVNKLVIYLNVVRQKQKKLEQDEKTNQKSSWQRNDGLIKYKSCLLYKKQDRGSTLKTEQSFARSVRV